MLSNRIYRVLLGEQLQHLKLGYADKGKRSPTVRCDFPAIPSPTLKCANLARRGFRDFP